MKQIKNKINHNIYFSIFYHIIPFYKKKNIIKYDLQNRSFLIVKRCAEKKLFCFQNDIKTYTFHNKFFKEYNLFISYLIRNNYIVIKDNNIKLSKKHLPIKKLLKSRNERKLKKTIHLYLIIPSFLIRRLVRKYFLKTDKELFKNDYDRYYSKDHSRPLKIGRPFLLKKRNLKKGAILVHGYLSAPAEVLELADLLFNNGYIVYCIRMRGHGTAPKDLAETSWEDWYYSINRGQMIIQNYVNDFILLGFSTGAGLALLQCTENLLNYKAVIAINAPLHLRYISSQLSDTIVTWNKIMDNMKLKKVKFEYVKHAPENMNINYQYNPIKGVHELHKAMVSLNEKLNNIHVPALIIQGKNDPIITANSAEQIYNKISSPIKKLVILKTRKHGILRGNELKSVAEEILFFLKKYFS